MRVINGIEFDEDELATQLKSSSRVDIWTGEATTGRTERLIGVDRSEVHQLGCRLLDVRPPPRKIECSGSRMPMVDVVLRNGMLAASQSRVADLS